MPNFDIGSAGRIAILFGGLAVAYFIVPYQERSLVLLLTALLAFFLLWLVRAGDEYSSFVLPIVFTLIVLLIVPILFTLGLSLFTVNGINLTSLTWPFAGWQNFKTIVESGDELRIFLRTLIFAVSSVAIEMLLGLAGGMLLFHSRAGYLSRSLLVLPVVIPPLVAGMLWRSMFDSSFGLFNRVLNVFGAGPIAWLALGDLAHSTSPFSGGLLAPIAAEVWQWTPFVVLVVSAAIAQQPPELAGWAKTQSGNRYREFILVSLPQLAPVLLLVTVLRMVDCLKAYDAIWAMYGNNIETATTSVRITTYALEVRNFGMGSAISVIFLVAVTTIAVVGAWPILRRSADSAFRDRRAQ
jgi:multiple sugar transport system permease protein